MRGAAAVRVPCCVTACLPRNSRYHPSPEWHGSPFPRKFFLCLPSPGCPLFVFSSQYNNISFHSPGALPPGSVLFPFRSPVLFRLFRRCPRLCSLVNAFPSPAVPCALRRGRTCFPAAPFRFSPHPSFRLEGQAPHGAQSRGRAGCVPEAAALRREEEMCRRGSVVRQRQEEIGQREESGKAAGEIMVTAEGTEPGCVEGVERKYIYIANYIRNMPPSLP